ncbi:nuclear envelope integral membrane protein 1-like isoform X2 [Ruditapes philippinarum]|uniref:nuclear envelope integral membrane protein 1-like isoform X2 n=1 Tax=Ruditapes philippinarum TaxID=129788 RepID=UPI00295BD8CE|nr:nuclear envelope integral membrane protein 1-like isoform X2 [Ruditapes philippinarum]
MFNYQGNIYHQVVDTWNRINVSTSGLSRPFTRAVDGLNMAASSAYYTLPSFMQTGLYDFYREWEMFYVDTYKWIHPKLTELSNTALHYSTGVSVGVIASVLILVFIISRLLPSRLKNLGYLLMFFGGSASLWILTTFTSILNNPMADTVVENWQYVLGYIVTAGVLSFAIVYRYGPVTDERSLSLIQWFLQLLGLVLVYNSTQIREVSIALIIILLTIYNFPRRLILNERSKNWWYRLFPPKIKLLTEDEYIIQGNIETKRELDKLREYCRSPECQAWKMISKLKSPQRFADFVEGNSWHVTNEELLEYDSGPDPTPPHLLSDDDDLEEEEMDFILSSP